MNHLLSIEQLTGNEIGELIQLAKTLKAERGTDAAKARQPLDGQVWAMIFSKSSTRTRVSFEVGIRELGGNVMFLSGRDMQLGRGEPIKDTARVLGRMVHGAVIRNDSQEDVVNFSEYAEIPTINALTDAEHPCQILADLLVMEEKLGGWNGKKVVFLGDADCNVARSWIWAAERLGFQLTLAAPEEFQPQNDILSKVNSGKIDVTSDAKRAAAGADVLYTDVWVSMGKEEEAKGRIEKMSPYQINDELLGLAAPNALVMHCLPAYREKEITESVLERHADTIFQEAENRLHAQKAVICSLVE